MAAVDDGFSETFAHIVRSFQDLPTGNETRTYRFQKKVILNWGKLSLGERGLWGGLIVAGGD